MNFDHALDIVYTAHFGTSRERHDAGMEALEACHRALKTGEKTITDTSDLALFLLVGLQTKQFLEAMAEMVSQTRAIPADREAKDFLELLLELYQAQLSIIGRTENPAMDAARQVVGEGLGRVMTDALKRKAREEEE